MVNAGGIDDPAIVLCLGSNIDPGLRTSANVRKKDIKDLFCPAERPFIFINIDNFSPVPSAYLQELLLCLVLLGQEQLSR